MTRTTSVRKLAKPEHAGISKERVAKVALDPLAGGAAISAMFSTGLFGESDLRAAYAALHESAKDVRDNKLGNIEDMLTAQAAALNAMFLELARRSYANMGDYMPATESYLRLALKAQAQCRATLETLATVKQPPVIYAHQANIAAGPQQVNNGAAAACVGAQTSLPNELLETEHGKRLEPGAARSAISCDSGLETVGEVDGAQDDRRQDAREL
jgi:hypothetical protein